jgi:hypothetical protein
VQVLPVDHISYFIEPGSLEVIVRQAGPVD